MEKIKDIKYVSGDQFTCPPVLYKYRDWGDENHQKILKENTVFLASPASFEDPLDCNLPEKYPSQEELHQHILETSKKEHKDWNRSQHRAFAHKETKDSPLLDIKKRAKIIEQFRNEYNSSIGVLSLTADPRKEEMWVKYADNHKGICFGFDTSKLFQVVKNGGEVQYKNPLPYIDFLHHDIDTKIIYNTFFKEEKWEFEKEYRLYKYWGMSVSLEERNINLLNNCISEIILGSNVSTDTENEIKKIVTEKYPLVKVIKEKDK